MDIEDAAYGLCDFVAWCSPAFLVRMANGARWEWKAMTGTLYPEGVFLMALYLAIGFAVLTSLLVVRAIAEDREDSAPSPSSPWIRRGSRRAST